MTVEMMQFPRNLSNEQFLVFSRSQFQNQF